jgi:MFS family permease
MTFVWALLTMACAACNTFSQLAAVRFFQGVAEASTYSGTQYIIGSWYKESEAGKRIGVFQASGMVGTMFAGEPVMQSFHKSTSLKPFARNSDDGHLEHNGWSGWPARLEMGKLVELTAAQPEHALTALVVFHY